MLAKALGACFTESKSLPPVIGGIATDSREVCAGDLFVALPGATLNGEDFVGHAIRRGAHGVLSLLPAVKGGASVHHFQVSDTSKALLSAASFYRSQQSGKVIAVTGSAGKTTVKEAIAAVLGDAPHSKGNFNSTLGMPLSVLSMPPAEHWVLELGISHRGEMQQMAAALQPDIGVLTNVGSAHAGEMGGRQAVFFEKCELARHVRPTGAFLLPSCFEKTQIPYAKCRLLRVGSERDADLCLEKITMQESGCRCDLKTAQRVITNLSWHTPGRIGSGVIGFAAGVGVLLDKSDAEIREGLCRAAQNSPRTKRRFLSGVLLLDDCYNASPEAMEAALEAQRYLAGGGERVAILGDILELGEYAVELHRLVGAAVCQNGVHQLITYGELAAEIAQGAREAGMPRHRIASFAKGEEDALLAQICAASLPGRCLLFKASHKMQMDEIMREVEKRLWKKSRS